MIEIFLLPAGVIALVVLVTVVYPKIQERREQELVKRLGQSKDPKLAMQEMDKIMDVHRHEAGFFRALVKYFWP